MRPRLLPFPWWPLAHLFLGIVLAPAALVIVGLGAFGWLVSSLSPRPLLAAGAALRGLVTLDRARFDTLTGQQLGQPLPPPDAHAPARDRAAALLADPAYQRAAGYGLVRSGLAVIEYAVLHLVLLSPLLAMGTLALAAWAGYEPSGRTTWFPTPIAVATRLPLLLVLIMLAVPWLVRGMVRLDAWATRALLGTPQEAVLQERVGALVAARSRSVSAAEAERTRLERDLHDGAQQRVVALSVLLGQAESHLDRADLAGTLALVQRARAEASGTLADLRALTRGLRPPILEARGLDAALSAVASRLPFPVTIDVDLRPRPDASIEGLLYFVVAEALTNTAKHAEAGSAIVTVRGTPTLVRATVCDDGRGGAGATPGGGLAGLADRLAGVDGRLFLSSPTGGPTV